MVQCGATLLRVENTGLVELEDELVSLNGDGGRSLSKSGLQVGDSARLDGSEVGNGDHTSVLICLTVTFDAGGARDVRVVAVKSKRRVHRVEEASLGPTAPAAEANRAGGGLLVGEGEKIASGDGVGALDRASGGEGPAGAACALILDGVDRTLLTPVDGVVGGGRQVSDRSAAGGRGHSGKDVRVLLGVPGRELVVGEFEIAILGVDLIDVGVLLGPDGKAVVELILVFKGQAVTS